MLNRAGDALAFLYAFVRTRWGYRFKTRQHLLKWQQKQLARFLHQSLAKIPFYRDLDRSALVALPMVDKATMLRQFMHFNAHGVAFEAAFAVALRAEQERDFRPTLPHALTVGLSSGTSGQRGVFLVSRRERSRWAGTILARVLSRETLAQLLNPVASPLQVAFFLRASSNLYTTVQSWRLRFHFGDLLRPMAEQVAMLNQLAPDILIAPPSVLHALARAQQLGQLNIAPRQLVSVAEVLEPDDVELLEQVWRIRPAQVYQCTEGFLGSTCSAGSLHLNEEMVHIEPEWQDAAHTRFTPIITDFSRNTQAFVRYRLDDILRLAPEPCGCARVSLRVAAIEGRQDDVLWLAERASGALQPVFADLIRRSMAMAQHHQALHALDYSDYRIEQRGAVWHLRLHTTASSELAQGRVVHELRAMCHLAGLVAPVCYFEPWVNEVPGTKRRRIRCISKPIETVDKGEFACASW